ncbi:hypothetical protein K443DRAFT_98482, partial [Laccaria amethystina LaAM-08-1]
TGPVFCSLGPVWLQSFSGHETGLPNTNGLFFPPLVRDVPTYYIVVVHSLNIFISLLIVTQDRS